MCLACPKMDLEATLLNGLTAIAVLNVSAREVENLLIATCSFIAAWSGD